MGSWHDRPDEQKLRDMQEYLRQHPERAREMGRPMATGPGNNNDGDGCVTILAALGGGIAYIADLAALTIGLVS